MKVILLSDVKKVGKKGEIVEVSDGYGRNFLLNKKLAVLATKKSMEILDEQNLQHDLEEKQKEADAQALKQKLTKITLEFHVKTGEGGRTFGSVSSKEISEAAKKQLNLDIDKKKLQLPEPIRTLGVTQVPVRLHPKVTGTLKVWVKEA